MQPLLHLFPVAVHDVVSRLRERRGLQEKERPSNARLLNYEAMDGRVPSFTGQRVGVLEPLDASLAEVVHFPASKVLRSINIDYVHVHHINAASRHQRSTGGCSAHAGLRLLCRIRGAEEAQRNL